LRQLQSMLPVFAKTTRCRCIVAYFIALALITTAACGSRQQQQAQAGHEEEAESRTEFTNRIENFFEYDPLHTGKPSQFLIHLTDLTDGTPVEKAEVTLTARPKGSASGVGDVQVKARVGKVTGIYVADVTLPSPGEYDIEFHVKNPKLDERLPLTDFKVE
jgi:hypothetical protein